MVTVPDVSGHLRRGLRTTPSERCARDPDVVRDVRAVQNVLWTAVLHLAHQRCSFAVYSTKIDHAINVADPLSLRGDLVPNCKIRTGN